MLFDSPVPFDDALQSTKVKALLPTDLSTAEIAKIDPAIREVARFSARTSNAKYLQEIQTTIDQILDPHTVMRDGKPVTEGMDYATGRLALKDKLTQIGYQPDAAERGTITDLGSDQRLNLVIKMNTELAQGYGRWAQGQDEAVLDMWPCQELIRAEDREEWRDWPARWVAAGGTLYPGHGPYAEGRMIARKDDPIWEEISAFGLPYPPFDFNSGMDIRDITRQESVELGVIDIEAKVMPQERDFSKDVETSVEALTPEIRAALLEDLGEGYTFKNGVLTYAVNEVQWFANEGGIECGGSHIAADKECRLGAGSGERGAELQTGGKFTKLKSKRAKISMGQAMKMLQERGWKLGDSRTEIVKGKGVTYYTIEKAGEKKEMEAGSIRDWLMTEHDAANEVTEPTPAQAAAGNYAKRHIRLHGMDIAIETPRGSIRRGKDRHGVEWSVKMPNDYGYVKRTEGADGDHVDVFVGPEPETHHVLVVDQIDPETQTFDEHKVMMGFRTPSEALEAYKASFSDGSGASRVGATTRSDVETLKTWFQYGDTSAAFAYGGQGAVMTQSILQAANEGDCGTGAGGFQPGNTCGSDDGTSEATHGQEPDDDHVTMKARELRRLPEKQAGKAEMAYLSSREDASLTKDQMAKIVRAQREVNPYKEKFKKGTFGHALQRFTTADYTKINAHPDSPVAKRLLTGLAKQKPMEGDAPLYRAMTFNSAEESNRFVNDLFDADRTVTLNRTLTSFSKSEQKTDLFADKGGPFKVHLKMAKHKSAREIGKLSALAEEKEAVLLHGACLKYVSGELKQGKGRSDYYLNVEEI